MRQYALTPTLSEWEREINENATRSLPLPVLTPWRASQFRTLPDGWPLCARKNKLIDCLLLTTDD